MKRINKKSLGILILALTLITTFVVFAENEDYAISLDYLNNVFMPKVKDVINESTTFSVLNVNAGQTFTGGAGCEFILRGGVATVKASNQGGIADVTTGDDLWQDSAVPANHHLIISRDDGRGFLATKDVIILVKGKYTIK